MSYWIRLSYDLNQKRNPITVIIHSTPFNLDGSSFVYLQRSFPSV